MLKGVTIICNYPDDALVEAAVPPEMNIDQLCQMLRKLLASEPDLSSFVVTAVIDKGETRAHSVAANH